jgi:hypothetical protein
MYRVKDQDPEGSGIVFRKAADESMASLISQTPNPWKTPDPWIALIRGQRWAIRAGAVHR